MSNERIDLETLDEIAKNAREMCHHERLLRVNVFTTESVVRELIAELKRYYGFVDELLKYFHHTTLEDESFMDLMYRMGVFEFEPEPWQNEKGEWMKFVGDTYETGEWVVDKDFTPNQEE